MLLLPVLANAVPPVASDPASAESVGWIILAIAAAAVSLEKILSVVRGFREMQAPDPGSVSADRVKALEDRVRTTEIQLASHMGAIDSKFQQISQTLTSLQNDWSYQIGKLDGFHDRTQG